MKSMPVFKKKATSDWIMPRMCVKLVWRPCTGMAWKGKLRTYGRVPERRMIGIVVGGEMMQWPN